MARLRLVASTAAKLAQAKLYNRRLRVTGVTSPRHLYSELGGLVGRWRPARPSTRTAEAPRQGSRLLPFGIRTRLRLSVGLSYADALNFSSNYFTRVFSFLIMHFYVRLICS